jgi:hypothetical protein
MHGRQQQEKTSFLFLSPPIKSSGIFYAKLPITHSYQ